MTATTTGDATRSLPPLASSPSLKSLSTRELKDSLQNYTTVATDDDDGDDTRRPFLNWATTFKSQPTRVYYPTSVEGVRRMVELARREHIELRAVGSGHSPSDLCCTQGYMINLKYMDKVIKIDSEACTYHAESGIKLSALHPILRQHNLAVPSLGSISDQTLAGCLSTATHGSGVNFGNLSTNVLYLDIVLPVEDAPVVRVSRESDEKTFLAALCGLGTLGIVVAVASKAEPAFDLEEECWAIGFQDFVDRWQEIAESAEHVRCWWFPQVGQVKVSRLNRTLKATTPTPSALTTYFQETFLAKHFHAVVLTLSRVFPNILPYHAHVMWALVHRPAPVSIRDFIGGLARTGLGFKWLSRGFAQGRVRLERRNDGNEEDEVIGSLAGNRFEELKTKEQKESVSLVSNARGSATSGTKVMLSGMQSPLPLTTKPTYRVDTSVNIFNYDCGFPQYTYEGCVPYEQTGATLVSLDEWLRAELAKPSGLRGHFPIEIRFTEKDDIYLSPTNDMRGTYIGAIQYRPFNLPVPYRQLFTEFEAVLLAHHGRPHWAKSHSLTQQDLAARYPRFHDFLAVREQCDPEQVLVNPYVRRHLLGQHLEPGMDRGRFRASGRG